MIDYKQKILNYIDTNKLTLRGIGAETGMSLSHVNKMKKDSDFTFTVNLFTRFLDAYKDNGIYEYVFGENKELCNIMLRQPTSAAALSDRDVRNYLLAVRNYTANGSIYPAVNIILDQHLTLTGLNYKKVPEKFALDGPQNLVLCRLLLAHIDPQETESSGISINPVYPNVNPAEWTEYLIETGTSIYWTDVSYLMRETRKKKNLTLAQLSSGSKTGTYFCICFEDMLNKNFNIGDVAKIDEFLGYDGKFLALCVSAARTTLAAVKIFPDADNKVKNTYSHALNSFFCLQRNIERKCGMEASEQFLSQLRSRTRSVCA
ncbi:MAG: hypothetical protein IJI14_20875 [Anaerolineaceae bacterium]|nr:hypothetical protein [Anaerolineaceae bacterium]